MKGACRKAASRARAALATLLLLVRSHPAGAGETDFLPDNVAWNGLGALSALAHSEGLDLTLLDRLDWSRLPTGASLMVIHPLSDLDPWQAQAFIEQGGRLLLADEVGRAAPLLQHFGIERLPGSAIRAGRNHAGNPHLPVAAVGPARHALNHGIAEIITNHPSYFLSRLPTLAGFAGGRQQLLVAGEVGKGRLVALSDPSVLIGAMLRFPGNRIFARNLLRHLRSEKDGRLFMVTGTFPTTGEVRRLAEPGSRRGAAQGFLAEFNQFLGEVNDFAMIEAAFRALGLVLAGLALVAVLLVLPTARRDLDGHWLRPQGAFPRLPEEIEASAGGRWQPSPARMASLLRDEVEEMLAEALDAPAPISTIHPSWVTKRVRERVGEKGARLCTQLLASLRRVPASPSAGKRSILDRARRGEVAQIYETSRELMSLLGREILPHPPTRDDHAPNR